MSEPQAEALTLNRQRGGTGVLLAALEDAWRAIAQHHPDLPATQIIVGQGSSRRSAGLLLGHLAPDRWQPTDGEPMHELRIAGEGLAAGANEVFTTLLHEAAHALAIARGIPDTSRDGRYHNREYKTLAEELGLIVTRERALGWSTTMLPTATHDRYTPAIDAIAAAITSHRLPEPAAAAARNLAAAICRCAVPRRIRVAPRTLHAGAITCELCHSAFTVAPPPDQDGGSAP